jgi:predicted nucleic acid-binding protein
VVRLLFDTCVLVDRLSGIEAARIEIDGCERPAISIITRIEILAGGPIEADTLTRRLLARFDTIALDDDIAERTAAIRRERRLKLPDAVILATAQARSFLLVTRDDKAFGPERPGVRFPYRL